MKAEVQLSSEELEQAAVVSWCDVKSIPIVHIPNEGKRSVGYAARLKRMGLRPGFPDLFIPLARGIYHGLFIEMKYAGGRASGAQEGWLRLLSREGYAVSICYGFDEAKRIIEKYLRMEKREEKKT